MSELGFVLASAGLRSSTLGVRGVTRCLAPE